MTRELSDGQMVPGTRYRVVGHLGSGGMGSVYLVEHTELGKQFVLKALFQELASRKDLVARLRQEWRALGRLDHPNIVNVTDAGMTDSGLPYYVMERVEGETLSALLLREHAISVPRAVHIMADVLDALSAAHDIGIVHRDVKPPNIFVASGGAVKLLDFGVAKLADSSAEVITARGVAIGTPRYMSPEQAKGRSVDARADLYAAGLVLYEAIAGAGPFDEARDANELILAHLSKEPPRLSSFHRGVKPELDDIVASLLAKEPSSRPASASLVAAALRAVVQRRSLPPSRGATPEAGYDESTGGHDSGLAASTRPDGVAGRRASEAPTLDAPASEATTSVMAGAPTLLGTGAVAAVDTQTTKPGLDWARDGFETAAAGVPLGNTRTWVSPPPADATQAPASDRDRTQPIEGVVPSPPNDVETRTAVPVAEPVSSVTHSGETPPPVLASASLSGRRSSPGASGTALAAGMVLALLGVVTVGWLAGRALRQEARQAAPPVEAPAAAAPAPSQLASAAPPPSQVASAAAEPGAPAPSASVAPASAPPPPKSAAAPPPQQPAKASPRVAPGGRRLPASGL